MLRRSSAILLLSYLLCSVQAGAQSPGALYTWNGTGNVQGWFKNFGTNTVTLANTVDGQLTVTETGSAGSTVAISDDFNKVFEASGGIGGLDLTGLSAISFVMGHTGLAPVNVQFFVQATPGATFVALGPDRAISPGDVKTYTVSIDSLTAAQKAYVRTIGINIRDHLADGNLTWTLSEVRSIGAALAARDYATFEPGSPDGGLQGAIVNFDNVAVEGNDGGQNQTGLSQNRGSSPPGNTGSLHWVDLGTGNGAAVTLANGTAFGGNTFNSRPTDMSNYQFIVVRMAATNRGGSVESLPVQYFVQSGGFNFHAAGLLTLPVDGEFHELCFPLEGIADLNFVEQHGVNLGAHAGGDLLIDIDNIRAGTTCDSAIPVLPTGGLALLAAALLAAALLALKRRPARAS